eukprot:PhM_4_TR14358/c0_g1_i1/m.94028
MQATPRQVARTASNLPAASPQPVVAAVPAVPAAGSGQQRQARARAQTTAVRPARRPPPASASAASPEQKNATVTEMRVPSGQQVQEVPSSIISRRSQYQQHQAAVQLGELNAIETLTTSTVHDGVKPTAHNGVVSRQASAANAEKINNTSPTNSVHPQESGLAQQPPRPPGDTPRRQQLPPGVDLATYDRVMLENQHLKAENGQFQLIERQFWALLAEREELVGEIKTLRASEGSENQNPSRASGNSDPQRRDHRADEEHDAGTDAARVKMLEKEVAALHNTQDEMQRALEECMELLMQSDGTTPIASPTTVGATALLVEKGGIVPRFLHWLRNPGERSSAPTLGKEEREGLAGEVQRLRTELQRVTEELDKADLSREQALEEAEMFQQRLAEASQHLSEARTAYTTIVNANRVLEAELGLHRECGDTIADLQKVAEERSRIIVLLQQKLSALGGNDAEQELMEDAQRIKADLEKRQQEEAEAKKRRPFGASPGKRWGMGSKVAERSASSASDASKADTQKSAASTRRSNQ